MTTIIAGVEIPETRAAAAASLFARENLSPLLFDHSRRVFLFGALRAAAAGRTPDPELLYVAAMMHDAGLHLPFGTAEQRFELDGADHARRLMVEHGASAADADIVWDAIALHTTPGIPARMAPVIEATQSGVLLDAVGLGLDGLAPDVVAEVLAAHPRGDFKHGFLQEFARGLAHRPDTTYGTVNADVLEHFEPGFQRGSMVDRVLASGWTE